MKYILNHIALYCKRILCLGNLLFVKYAPNSHTLVANPLGGISCGVGPPWIRVLCPVHPKMIMIETW